MYSSVISLFFFFPILSSVNLFSQEQTPKFTISGYVKEKASGEFSIGANVYVKKKNALE